MDLGHFWLPWRLPWRQKVAKIDDHLDPCDADPGT
jgi:hypothetical protein